MRLLCARNSVFILQTDTRNRHHDWTLRVRCQATRFWSSSRQSVQWAAMDDNWWEIVAVYDAGQNMHATWNDSFSTEWFSIILSTWRPRGHPDEIFQLVAPKQKFIVVVFCCKHNLYTPNNMHKKYGAGSRTVSQAVPPHHHGIFGMQMKFKKLKRETK